MFCPWGRFCHGCRPLIPVLSQYFVSICVPFSIIPPINWNLLLSFFIFPFNPSTASYTMHLFLVKCPSQFIFLFTMVYSSFISSLILFNTSSCDTLSLQGTLTNLHHTQMSNASIRRLSFFFRVHLSASYCITFDVNF